jgi:chemotaxis protein CheD
MHIQFNSEYGKDVLFLDPGEYAATREDIIISTLLGSCIAVVLHDSRLKIGGMNHFMLPGKIEDNIERSEKGRYGMTAIELLVNELFKRGSRKSDLEAKIFGGASVLHLMNSDIVTIGSDNVKFARKYLEIEKIPIISSSVGGRAGRRILYFPQTFTVRQKMFSPSENREVLERETDYLCTIKKTQISFGEYHSFTDNDE